MALAFYLMSDYVIRRFFVWNDANDCLHLSVSFILVDLLFVDFHFQPFVYQMVDTRGFS